MPVRPRRPCNHPGCKELIRRDRYCPTHKAKAQRAYDTLRGTAHSRGYTHTWAKARLRYLKANPICIACNKQGRLTAAEEVDHIIPHKGNQELFWDESNWQSLCGICHKRKTAKEGSWGK